MNEEKIKRWCIIAFEYYLDCDISDKDKEEIVECLEFLYG